MSITRTSLIHPTMIGKIRAAMYYANKGMGHMMNGHNKRCYIQNSKGHNIMRLDWVGGPKGYIVYGQESRDITKIVKSALASVVVRELVSGTTPQQKRAERKGRFMVGATKAAAILAASVALTACQSSGTYTVMSSFFCAMFT